MGLPGQQTAAIAEAALLHDIGKIGVPDAILQKPSELTPKEKTIMDMHSHFGWVFLRRLPGFQDVAEIVRHHHEWHDGTGYPSKLKGEEIPLGARIVSVLDAFDAITSRRPYGKPMNARDALEEIARGKGIQFDPAIVDILVPILRS
jgi:HD-GYP domain-containing protein (c-di-GMP phosphodiesterase class II)